MDKLVMVNVEFAKDLAVAGRKGAYRVGAATPMQRLLEVVSAPLPAGAMFPQVAAKVGLEPGRLLLTAAGDSGVEEVPGEVPALRYSDSSVTVSRRAEA